MKEWYNVTLKVYRRHSADDKSYTIYTVVATMERIKKWQADPWFYEVISYSKM